MRRILRIVIILALPAAAAACGPNRAWQPGFVDHNNDRHYWEE